MTRDASYLFCPCRAGAAGAGAGAALDPRTFLDPPLGREISTLCRRWQLKTIRIMHYVQDQLLCIMFNSEGRGKQSGGRRE